MHSQYKFSVGKHHRQLESFSDKERNCLFCTEITQPSFWTIITRLMDGITQGCLLHIECEVE